MNGRSLEAALSPMFDPTSITALGSLGWKLAQRATSCSQRATSCSQLSDPRNLKAILRVLRLELSPSVRLVVRRDDHFEAHAILGEQREDAVAPAMHGAVLGRRSGIAGNAEADVGSSRGREQRKPHGGSGSGCFVVVSPTTNHRTARSARSGWIDL